MNTPGSTRADDPSFDRYARMVQRYLEVPIALVTLVLEDRQVFTGASGLAEPLATTRETPLSHSFCRYVVDDEAPLIIEDARRDDRLRDNPSIPEHGVIAYAGWPLIDEQGRTVGSLCAMDTEPRGWTREDLDALEDLADACSAELMYRNGKLLAEEQAERDRDMSHRSQALLALSEGLSATRTLDDIARAVEHVAVQNLGCLHAGIWLPQPDPGGADTLRYIAEAANSWSSSARNADLALDGTNPIGETMTSGRPQYFPDCATQNLRYPRADVTTQVGEARAFMPLSLDRVFGTLVLVWPDARDISAEQRITIEALTSYVAQAVQRALLFRDRENASLILQSAMLTRLPTSHGMELTARYQPAAAHDRVGGDWYDAVVMPSGETNLMVGDVAGHDIAAAAVMGELRSMLRAFAWAHDDDGPADNVTRLDRAMAGFGIGRFASLVFARIEPADGTGHRTMHWTNAGHFPPLLVQPDGNPELLGDGDTVDVVLGVGYEGRRHDRTTTLPAGSTLLLYTDGLIERRGESIDIGLARLREAAGRHHELRPDAFLDAVVEDLVGDVQEDDVAVLAVRFG